MGERPPTWSCGPLGDAELARLCSTRFGEVRWFTEVDSTNRYLLDQAGLGAPEGLVVVADRQSAGRGRRGRRWESPAGSSLLASVLLRPAREPDTWHQVTSAAALAAAESLRDLAAIAVRLKWPNDLVVGDRKLAGLLAETDPAGALVVGMGVNLCWESFPQEIAETATSCNLESSQPVGPAALLVAWLERLDARLGALERPGGDAELREACTAWSATVGCRVRVDLGDRTIEGRAERLSEVGALEVRCDDGSTVVVTAGDVVHLRRA